jgi:hypothetical protein
MNVTLKSTPAKYQPMASEMIQSLLALLKELTSLEEEVFKRNREMNAEKTVLNIPSNQIHPKWEELMTEKVSKKLISNGYALKYENPSEYFYLNSDEFSLEFTMSKEDMAAITIRYNKAAIDMKHKFVLRLIDDKWLVDEKYYGFEGEDQWYSDSI